MRFFRVLSALLVAGIACSTAAAEAGPFTFDTLPADGAISGVAGTTIGWGYTISNPSATDWLLISDLNADTFSNGTAQSLFDFPILAPGDSATVSFDATAGLGLYQLTWDPGAPTGFINAGTFTMAAQWYDGDPFGGGVYLEDAPDATADYAAAVVGAVTADPSPVPEPSTLALVGVALAAWRISQGKRHLA